MATIVDSPMKPASRDPTPRVAPWTLKYQRTELNFHLIFFLFDFFGENWGTGKNIQREQRRLLYVVTQKAWVTELTFATLMLFSEVLTYPI